MKQDALAFWTVSPGRGEIRAEPIGPRRRGEVMVRTLYTGISRGTEALVFNGRVPVSEWQRMRAPFQAGQFPGAVKYGYANVGRVEEGPPDLLGRVVFCLYPHQTRYVVPATAVHPIPDQVPAARAVLVANLETAINGLWDAAPRIGDRVVVVGAGTVGCLLAWLAGGIHGCDVTLVDIDPRKATAAAALGVAFAAPDAVVGEADVVLHASGTAAGLGRSLELAGFEAEVVDLSWYGCEPVPAPLGGAFHSRRLTLRSSQVGAVAPARRARWSAGRRTALALALLGDPRLDALITGEDPFASLPDIMATLAAEPGAALCHRIAFGPDHLADGA